MKKTLAIFVIVSFFSFQLFGCATMTNTQKGTAAGAVTGGILGAVLGNRRGAIIGSLAGAVVGAVIGSYYDKQLASRAEAAERYKYKDREQKLEIENSSVVPKNVVPSSAVRSYVQYTILAPNQAQRIKITETRILVSKNERLVLAKRDVLRAQGTHISTIKFTMPRDIAKGDYALITIVSDRKRTKSTKNLLRVV